MSYLDKTAKSMPIPHFLIVFLYIKIISENCRCQIFNHILCATEGEVGNENFSYYDIHYRGNIVFILHTIKGDADLYITKSGNLPTYDPKSYDIHSATCGEDIIEIPKNFSNKIIAGVYGYSANEHTKYSLTIYKKLDREENAAYCTIEQITGENKEPQNRIEVKKKSKKTRSTAAKVGILSLLEILQLVFT